MIETTFLLLFVGIWTLVSIIAILKDYWGVFGVGIIGIVIGVGIAVTSPLIGFIYYVVSIILGFYIDLSEIELK